MAARTPHPQTILHLVPKNNKADALLVHPDNEPYVSQCRTGKLGLEIGYHVAAKPCPEKLVEVGRNADLILPGSTISAVQFSFEVHPQSNSIMFFDRSRHYTTKIDPPGFRSDGLFRQVVVQPGVKYKIGAGGINKDAYQFDLVWLGEENDAVAEVERGYLQAAQRPSNPRWARTVDDTATELPAWYKTRLQTPNGGGVERFQICAKLGAGAFGVVSKAIDLDSGCFVAVKTLHVPDNDPKNYIQREVITLSQLSHKNIVEYLGSQSLGTSTVNIFIALKEGNTTALFAANHSLRGSGAIFNALLHQMLEALDYLAYRSLIHRDVKPDNILYTQTGHNYLFQLSDFGLARKTVGADTFCGTYMYMAPEMVRHGVQTSKMDVWSLMISILVLMLETGFEGQLRNYEQILPLVKAAVLKHPELASMGQEDPNARDSAAQLLVRLYNGKGLTTPISQLRAMTGRSLSTVAGNPGPKKLTVPAPRAAIEPAGHRCSKPVKRQLKTDRKHNAALLYRALS